MLHLREPYTLQGVQELLKRLMDEFGLAEYELSKRSGVTAATIYGILAETGEREVRRSTLRRIAESLGCKISFSQKTVTLTQLEKHPRERNRLTKLAEAISNIILTSGKDDISKEQVEKIKEVLKVMLR